MPNNSPSRNSWTFVDPVFAKDGALPGRKRAIGRAKESSAGATLPGRMKLAGLAHHFDDLSDVLLLKGDLLPGVFFRPHALVHDEREQVVVLAKSCALVIERFT